MKAKIIADSGSYFLIVSTHEEIEMRFKLSKAEINSLGIDIKNILKIENTYLNVDEKE